MCSVTWLCCSNMLPLRGEQQATGENLAKSIDISVIKVIEAMKAKEQLLTIYPQVLENIRATDKSFVQNDPDVQKAIQSVAEALGSTGHILVWVMVETLATVPVRSTSARWWRLPRARGVEFNQRAKFYFNQYQRESNHM